MQCNAWRVHTSANISPNSGDFDIPIYILTETNNWLNCHFLFFAGEDDCDLNNNKGKPLATAVSWLFCR